MSDLVRQLLMVIRQQRDADPHAVARACIEAAFDHALNPMELDHEAPPTENEADQVERVLVGFVQDEGRSVRDFIRRHSPP